jgi:membrane protein
MASLWRLGGLSWLQLARRVGREIQDDDLFGRAAQLSYYFLLALFPLLLFLTSLLGYFAQAGTQLRTELLSYLGAVAPAEASALINTTVDEVSRATGGGKLSFGLLAALWAASSGMGALSDALNVAYEVKETRPWWRVRLIAIGLTITLSILILSALVLVLFGGHIANVMAAHFMFGNFFKTAWQLLQWVLVLVFVLLAFALLYYIAPDLKERRWYWVSPGSVLAILLWLLVSFAFRLYLHYFNSYSATYGSLGAVIILMLWFYLTGAAVLIGGEVNSEISFATEGLGKTGGTMRGEIRPKQQER